MYAVVAVEADTTELDDEEVWDEEEEDEEEEEGTEDDVELDENDENEEADAVIAAETGTEIDGEGRGSWDEIGIMRK